MDVLEVLGVTIDVLRGIMIPVELAEQVGKPVLGAIGNLRLCIEAMENQAAAAAPSVAAATSPQLAGETGEEGEEG